MSADDAETKRELQRLRQQNEQLQRQLQEQQERIESLGKTVSELQRAPPRSGQDAGPALDNAERESKARSPATAVFGKVHLGAEGGLGFFRSEANGQFPNAEFRVDEAKLFVEAPVWANTYFFSEINLTLRESSETYLSLGELYLDFENLSRLWHRDGQVNLRVGRFDIPFGEEYLTRDAIDNPLISHSLADFWGVDEGLEFYGRLGQVQYVFAVQNGGHPSLRDFNADKSLALRLSHDPAQWLHLSVSAMRTGDLDVKKDKLSELWFAKGFVRSLDSSNTTRFGADLFQGDVRIHWQAGHGGHASASGGYLHYTDDDRSDDNQRDVYFYSVEALQHLTKQWYGAARFSQILARHGFPLVGDGSFSEYFYRTLSEDLWRLSLGMGCQFSPNLLLKAEYSFNQGHELGGAKRIHENMVSTVLAFKF